MTEEANFSSGPDDAPENAGAPLEQSGVASSRPEEPWIPEAGSRAGDPGDDSEGEPSLQAGSAMENFMAEDDASPAVKRWTESGFSCPGDEDEEDPAGLRYLGVRMRKAGQVFFFPDQHSCVRVGSKVIVEFEQGSVFGEVDSIIFSSTLAVDNEAAVAPGRVIGPATAQDIARHAENRILAAEANAFCTTCIRQRSLDMKMVDVEVLHDRSKIIFYFTAPSRIDFRELVKDLVRTYRTRIELRQIGVRHETQMVGGLGNCGMVCCCHKYLRKFAPVTIKMAKEQNLFLNPAKLSGMCGRLLCCLSFEQGNYEEFNKRCPKLGKKYATSDGMFRVVRANMFNQSIVVCSDSGEENELTLEEWESKVPRRADPQVQDTPRAAQPQRPSGDNGRKGRSRGPDDRNAGGRPGSGERGAELSARSEPATNGDAPSAEWEHGEQARQAPRPDGNETPRKRRPNERGAEETRSDAPSASGVEAPGTSPDSPGQVQD